MTNKKIRQKVVLNQLISKNNTSWSTLWRMNKFAYYRLRGFIKWRTINVSFHLGTDIKSNCVVDVTERGQLHNPSVCVAIETIWAGGRAAEFFEKMFNHNLIPFLTLKKNQGQPKYLCCVGLLISVWSAYFHECLINDSSNLIRSQMFVSIHRKRNSKLGLDAPVNVVSDFLFYRKIFHNAHICTKLKFQINFLKYIAWH